MTNNGATDKVRQVHVANNAPSANNATDNPSTSYGNCAGDYVHAVILNRAGEALIVEDMRQGSWSSWQIPGGALRDDEDPVTAVQRRVLEETGLKTNAWIYLGSYVGNACHNTGVGHYFVAKNVDVANLSAKESSGDVKWVPLADLKYALLDGRIATVRHAIAVSLAFLTVV